MSREPVFPSTCPFLQHRLEPLEGLSKAVSCMEAECPWYEDECLFTERLLELIARPTPPKDDESAA